MRVFIVGATGGVGHRVAQRLRASGHAVTAIVRRAEQAESLGRQGITPIIPARRSRNRSGVECRWCGRIGV